MIFEWEVKRVSLFLLNAIERNIFCFLFLFFFFFSLRWGKVEGNIWEAVAGENFCCSLSFLFLLFVSLTYEKGKSISFITFYFIDEEERKVQFGCEVEA